MITNPQATRILCFGDSNTWGQRPDRKGRFAANQRWTGILQQQLGDSYEVIEEGLNSRTTDLEYAKKAGRNGKTYFIPLGINVDAPLFDELYTGYYDGQSSVIADELAGQLQEVAKKESVAFIDAALCAQPGEDGIHMDQQGHLEFAKALAAKIKELTA